MERLVINGKYGLVDVDCTIDKGITVIGLDSGTGKTYLAEIIRSYCLQNDIPHFVMNYTDVNSSLNLIGRRIAEAEVVVLDNADLYLCSEILEMLNDKIALVFSRKISYIEFSNNCEIKAKYIKYSGDKIRVVE